MKSKSGTDKIRMLPANTSPDDILRDIAQSGVQEDAFFVLDIGDIVNKHLEWISKMPRVAPFYAVKCNDSQLVLEVLAALGTGFDCASKTEICKVLALGVDSDRIIYANPTKMASHIRYAKTHDITTMTFDNECELYKVKNLYPDARMVLRIRCDATEAHFPLGLKFGCDVITEAPHLLSLAKMLGINVVGISFHVGSGCMEPLAFRRGIAAARDLFELGTELGFSMEVLDIGGGYTGNQGHSLDKYAEVINTAIDDFFSDASMEHVRIIAEPGQFYVASAFTLATQIHSKRDNMYYINDGTYGSLNCNLYKYTTAYPVPLEEKPGKLQSSTVWGPTCDSTDKVVQGIMLPPLDVGDWLIFRNMGAYTISTASTFNGYPIPKVLAVVNKSIWYSLKGSLPLTEDHVVTNYKLEKV